MRYPVILMLFICGPLCAKIHVKDDRGNDVVLEARASRIVSLAPHLTEVLFTLGVGEKIVGTVKYSDYPSQAKQIPRLGDAFSLNIEAVLEMQPDIIFAWHTGGVNKAVQRLKALGIPVYVNESATLDSIADGLVRIATLVSTREQGLLHKRRFLQRLNRLKVDDGDGNDRERPRVFFQISDQDLYTVNDSHLIGQAIHHCGGRNLFANLSPGVALVSKEAVLAGQPDLIILTSSPSGPDSPWVDRWNVYDSFKGKIRILDPGLISRPSFRMLAGIEELCRLIAGPV